jgi:hypothetical protein
VGWVLVGDGWGEGDGEGVGDADGEGGSDRVALGLGLGDGLAEGELGGALVDDFFGFGEGEEEDDTGGAVGTMAALVDGGIVFCGAVETSEEEVGDATAAEVTAALPGPPLFLLSSSVCSAGEPRSAIMAMMTNAAAATAAAATSAELGSPNRRRPIRTSC